MQFSKVQPVSSNFLDPTPKESRCGAIRSGLQELFHEYCSQTTIHGISYLRTTQRSPLERLLWLVVCLVSTYCCGWLIRETYHKWDEKPVIVSFSERSSSVWSIPFPAVTVCPEAKTSAEVMNITECWYRFYAGDPSLDEMSRDRLMAVMQICDDYFHTYEHFYRLFTNDSLDVLTLLVPLRGTEEEWFIIECLKGKLDCQDRFHITVTEDGLCFTYNGFSQQDMFRKGVLANKYYLLDEPKSAANWSLEGGYKKGSPLWTHPTRGTDDASRLIVHLMSELQNLDTFCREAQGFRLLLHSPDEFPTIRQKAVTLSFNRDITVAVHPHLLTTSEELRAYTPERRQCLFAGERQLKFFRIYNQVNCKLECLVNYTLKVCGCVKFSMPYSAGTRVCSTREIHCVLAAEVNLQETIAEKRSANPEEDISPCNCMPACSSIQYRTEITQLPYDLGRTDAIRARATNFNWVEHPPEDQLSRVQIYFKEVQFISTRRSEMFGITDFIANCGGILGLCLGISLFSVVELLYYCTVRPLLLIGTSVSSGRKVIVAREGIK